jgi:RHS repeat-associated protein
VYGDLTKRQERVNGLPTVTLDYQYDKNHQLKQLSQSGLGVASQVMEFGYDRLNQLTNISRATANASGELVTDYQYNEVGLLKDINNYFVKPTVVNPITTISNYHYDYDAGNRLTLKSGTDGNSVIDYGKDNQLKSVDNSSRADEVYSFNALGIRNNWSTVTGDSRQILNDGKYVYKYDDEGNLQEKKELVSGNITNYEWDYRNRLTKVSSAGQTVEYQYDAEDRRVGKVINGVTKEKYIYDGQDIALVVNSAGTITERYLYGSGVDNVLSREANGQVTWSLGDKQGSIVDLVNEQGEVVNHFVYDSFGNRTEATSADFRFGYTGRELDAETGLYYYRARYYDAAIGRFISEDPIGFSAGDTNLYRYVGNNATNYTDPSGQIVPLIAAGMVAMGVMNALIDVNVQLAVNNMTDKTDMNWASVGVSFGTGMLGFGLAQKATQVGTTAWKIAANPLTQRALDSGIDGVGKIVENQINGKAWNDELAETVAGNFLLGSAADLGIKGAGKVWSKYGDSITSVGNKAWDSINSNSKSVITDSFSSLTSLSRKTSAFDVFREHGDFIGEWNPVTIKQVKIALGQAGMSVKDYKIRLNKNLTEGVHGKMSGYMESVKSTYKDGDRRKINFQTSYYQ